MNAGDLLNKQTVQLNEMIRENRTVKLWLESRTKKITQIEHLLNKRNNVAEQNSSLDLLSELETDLENYSSKHGAFTVLFSITCFLFRIIISVRLRYHQLF